MTDFLPISTERSISARRVSTEMASRSAERSPSPWSTETSPYSLRLRPMERLEEESSFSVKERIRSFVGTHPLLAFALVIAPGWLLLLPAIAYLDFSGVI